MNHYDLLLIGAGHAHLGVLRRWARLERPPGRIALLSAGHQAWCSGMLPGLLAGHSAGLRLRALGHLRQRGVRVREDCPISRIDDDCLISGEAPDWRGQRLLLASGAQALPWLAQSGLGCAADGFVQVAASLQSLSHPHIFAVGDCASLPGARKSGVYSVRQAPVLAANLNAALLSWRDCSAGGQLFGRWKDYLDRGFIQRHRLSG